MSNGYYVVVINTNHGKRVATDFDPSGEVLAEIPDLDADKLIQLAHKYSAELSIPLFEPDVDEIVYDNPR